MNYRGKTDVAGKPFRDEIVAGALQNGTGRVDYAYINPVETGLYYKRTYYQLVRGSDGKQYVVCSGTFQECGGSKEENDTRKRTPSVAAM